MARKSNKSESERIAELERKIASLRGVEAEKKFADIPVIQTLRNNLEGIQSEMANSKPLLASEGIRSFDVRIEGATLKVNRYKAEKAHNQLINEFGSIIEKNISEIMGECVKRLNAGEKPETVNSYVNKAQLKFKNENKEMMDKIEKSIKNVNAAIELCEKHSAKNSTNQNSGEKGKNFFKSYSNPFNS